MECTGGIVNSTTVWHKIVKSHPPYQWLPKHLSVEWSDCRHYFNVLCVALCKALYLSLLISSCFFKVVAFCLSFLIYRGRFLMNPHWNVWSCCLRSGHSETRRWELNSLTCQKSMFFFFIILFCYPEFCSFFFFLII